MTAPPAPGPLGRLCRGHLPVALLAALLVAVCAAFGSASASAVDRAARPAAKPAEGGTGTKPLVFMGFGTMAGLTLLAGAGLVASVRRRRATAPGPTAVEGPESSRLPAPAAMSRAPVNGRKGPTLKRFDVPG
ncbi:hypothetical protein ABZ851_13290 [Streptomyces sp. NPDC047049]|uniref:hypothetical protein n=1 Tax=Streptomyces sp. NPDC047049 TaxID=3156688 RepID=UPI003405F6C3